jgi:transposase
MVVVDGQGIPVGAQLASAQLAECRLAESTLATVKVPRKGRGRPRSHMKRIIADRGYDSDALRTRFHQRGTELIVPYRKYIRNRRFEDKRKLRRYRKRWKIERTNAWLQNFRRIQVRYDRVLTVFQGFFHCACLIIALRHLCNQF